MPDSPITSFQTSFEVPEPCVNIGSFAYSRNIQQGPTLLDSTLGTRDIGMTEALGEQQNTVIKGGNFQVKPGFQS